jgi:tungstate transport system ATP-binding protein
VDKGTIRQKVDHWLEVFGISHLSNRQAYQLSGGEAQRVSLARAFVTGADLLLLDEPFSSLDAPTRLGLLNDFQSILKSSRQTAIFITHDLDEALMLGSQIAILIGGQLRQVGSPRQVFDEPADSEVADFVGVETIISGEICTQKDGLVEVQTGDNLLEAVSDYQVGKMVYLCLRPEDITISNSLSREQSSARNHLRCKIITIQPKGPLFRVLLDSGDAKLVSLVTRTSALEMNLVPGLEVIANFKSSAIHLLPR